MLYLIDLKTDAVDYVVVYTFYKSKKIKSI